MNGAHMEAVADLAIRTALTRRAVAHITIPVDVQVQSIKKDRSPRNPMHHTTSTEAYAAHVPAQADLEHAADVLNRGKKIVILAGAGALHATVELVEMADRLGAPIVKALLGKAAVPDDSPYTTGGIGLLGTEASQDASRKLRHSFDRRLLVSLHRIPAQAGSREMRADRPRSAAYCPTLPGRCRTRRRCAGVPARLASFDQGTSAQASLNPRKRKSKRGRG